MKRFKAPIGSQSGQAVVEYVLLLIVVTLIAGGALYKFSTAFQSFATSYFGNYLACLLESGELPALGSDGSSAKGSGGICNDSFKAFSMADGRPANGNGGGTGASGDGAGGASGKKNGNTTNGGGGGSGDSTKVGGLNGSFGRANGRPVSAIEKGGAGKDEAAPGDAGVGGGARSFVKAPSAAREKRTEVQLTGSGIASEDDKDEGQHANKKVAETAENRLRKKRELLPPPRKPAALDEEDKDEGFGFSGFFRWLLIGAMILAILVFLGQQALSISKSQE